MELLAPVGTIRSLYAAINNGADAVYLGLDGFNARAKAVGFTKENIGGYIDLCHLHGVKVYITFNTAVKEKELDELESYVAACTRADAFIIEDLGAVEVFRKYGVPLHASTQMGVNNLQGALFLEKLGFSRVVVARESAKEDIIAIKKNTGLEVEYFVHGALCVSYSGSCLLSSMMSGDSGNRGRCNQPCRLPYTSSISGKSGYLLSPSEQCLITRLKELEKLGIDSLKIEGRLKQPHYVSKVVSQYRQVLDGAKADESKVSELKKAFNRGEFTCGYMFDDTRAIMSPKVQSNIGVPVGKVTGSGKNFVKIKAYRPLRDGDGLKLLYKGVEAGGFGVKIISADKNGNYTLFAKEVYPVGAEVRMTLDSRDADEEIRLKKIPVNMHVTIGADDTLVLTVEKGETTSVSACHVQAATGRPLTSDEVRESVAKLGETAFECAGIDVDLKGREIFVPRSVLNALRRDAVEKLKEALIRDYETRMPRLAKVEEKGGATVIEKTDGRRIIVNTDDFAVIKSLCDKNIAISYQIYDFSQFLSQIDIFLALIENNFNSYLHLPPVVKGDENAVVEDILQRCKGRIRGLICENYHALFLAEKYSLESVAGIRLNVYNSGFQRVSGVDSVIFSPELTLSEIRDIGTDGFVYAYGYLPVMTLCHCPVQVSTGCTCANCAYIGDFCYRDKKADYLIKRIRIKRCYFELFNPSVVDISSKADKIRYNLYINMVNCNRDPVQVVDSVTIGGQSVKGSNCAHLFRGVK